MPPISFRRYFPWLTGLLLGLALWSVTRWGDLPPADYTIANGTEVSTLDPAQADGSVEGRVIWNLFEGLCVPDPKDLSPQPGVAERWELSDNNQTYRFYLRQNAKWSDGKPVTAHDFVWTFRRLMHPVTACPYAYETYYIKNAEKYLKRQLQAGDPVELDLTEDVVKQLKLKTSVEAPFNRKLRQIKGELIEYTTKVLDPDKPDEKSYRAVVKLEGQNYTFDKDDPQAYPAEWILLDFEQVPVRALDDYTLEIKLQFPVPYFLDLMAFYPFSPVQRDCVLQHGIAWTQPGKMVTNGAFKLDLRRFRERIRLVKNEHYWDREQVQLQTVDFLAVEGQATSLNLYLTGGVDWIERVPNSVIPDLLEQQRPDFAPAEYITTAFYRLNVTSPPLHNRNLRQALNMAIDKQQICERITRAGQRPARNLVSDVIKDHRPGLAGPFDPVRARELYQQAITELKASGYPVNDQQPIQLTLQFNTNEQHRAVAEYIQDQWQTHLGLRVELNGLEWGAYQKNQDDLKYQISRAGWIGDYKNPITFLKMFTSTSEQNQTGWKSAAYDDLVMKAQRAKTKEEQQELFHQAETMLMEELPIIPLFFDVSSGMSRTYVKGVYPNYHDVHPLKAISIDQAEKARVLAEERAR
jgi:oligopeptide transport system substrate-binding protein